MWENIEYIKGIIEQAYNKTDVLNKLNLSIRGGNYNTLTAFIIEHGIDITHFNHKKSKYGNIVRMNILLDDILLGNANYKSSDTFKKRLYKEGLKNPICELCGQNENWCGKRMSLILDHINGDRYDNKLSNLQIVCPNCNATLETHCRGNRKLIGVYDICECGGKKRIESKRCKSCVGIKNTIHIIEQKDNSLFLANKKEKRTVDRPSYKELLLLIKELGYSGTGKKYNVSDNAIRKWVKMYEKYGEEF